ncbi:PREDICTED: uncharacterized protein LOC109116028 [Tarenaya hassleriana]|uniref:uncharacterized protein LOC109116028 n=1 Tax=Tarenaya hassleriana TaxID=28532 RepID=UPI0008FD5EF5|nr:PREDICTED: uncharacterized protein LOC109116028 [Tarenaya hassleriana]
MGSVTALCFAPFLIELCQPRKGLRAQTVCQIVLETQDVTGAAVKPDTRTFADIRFTVFKPSVISASAILTALSYLYRKHYMFYENILMTLDFIDKEEVRQCMPLMREMCARKKIWMETVETDLRGRPLVRVQAAALEPAGSSILAMEPVERRRETQPWQEPELDGEEPGPVPEIQQVDESLSMDFELKWVIEDDDVGSLLSPAHSSPCFIRHLSCSNAERCPCTVL